jgi:hypothetical protein
MIFSLSVNVFARCLSARNDCFQDGVFVLLHAGNEVSIVIDLQDDHTLTGKTIKWLDMTATDASALSFSILSAFEQTRGARRVTRSPALQRRRGVLERCCVDLDFPFAGIANPDDGFVESRSIGKIGGHSGAGGVGRGGGDQGFRNSFM